MHDVMIAETTPLDNHLKLWWGAGGLCWVQNNLTEVLLMVLQRGERFLGSNIVGLLDTGHWTIKEKEAEESSKGE